MDAIFNLMKEFIKFLFFLEYYFFFLIYIYIYIYLQKGPHKNKLFRVKLLDLRAEGLTPTNLLIFFQIYTLLRDP